VKKLTQLPGWFVIFRRDGDILTLGEARRVMQEYGHVSQVAMHEDHSSVKVQFENFNPQQRDFQLVSRVQRNSVCL
jgi:hypothetical protein